MYSRGKATSDLPHLSKFPSKMVRCEQFCFWRWRAPETAWSSRVAEKGVRLQVRRFLHAQQGLQPSLRPHGSAGTGRLKPSGVAAESRLHAESPAACAAGKQIKKNALTPASGMKAGEWVCFYPRQAQARRRRSRMASPGRASRALEGSGICWMMMPASEPRLSPALRMP